MENVKTCLQNTKLYLMPLSRHGHFHPILILPVKMVKLLQQHAKITVHFITNCWKELLPKCSRVLRSIFEKSPCMKTSLISYENQSFFCYFKMLPLLLKIIVFFSVTFYNMMKYFFDQLFTHLLPLFCFYRSSKWLFKVKITCKIVNFIEK